MTIDLPKSVANFFDADKGPRTEAFAACFSPAAIVKDDGHIHTGHDAICQWKDDYMAKYDCTAEPLSVSDEGYRVVVVTRITGNFPDSPIDLRYFFVLDGEKIAELEIIP